MITGRADPGGGPEHVFQLSRELLKECEVFIAAPNERPYWPRYCELVGPERVFEIPHRAFSWEVLRQLEGWCRRNEIDVVHSHGRGAGIYGRLLRRRALRARVHTPHGTLQFKSSRDIVAWFADAVLARRTDLTIAVSRSEREQLRRRLFIRSGLVDIPNGVLLPSASVLPVARRGHPLRIVHITRFVPQKNTGMVLDILTRLRERGALDRFHVDMLGDGPQRAALEAEAHARGLGAHVTFHGAKDSVALFLARAFCLLSTSRWEGMPLAVLEALAAGVPVVASDIPGNNDVVQSSVGRLFALGDAETAAEHLVELARNEQVWLELARGAAELARTTYSVERMAAATRAQYERLLSADANRGGSPSVGAAAAVCPPGAQDAHA